MLFSALARPITIGIRVWRIMDDGTRMSQLLDTITTMKQQQEKKTPPPTDITKHFIRIGITTVVEY